jgi:peptidoglycan/LPS O-acetylase OafA/YrhL
LFNPAACVTFTAIMRRLALFLALLVVAVAVVGISFALMRTLHSLTLSYILIAPIWFTVLGVLVIVARAAFRGGQEHQPEKPKGSGDERAAQ